MAILHRPFSMERWSVLIIRLVILYSLFLSGVLCFDGHHHHDYSRRYSKGSDPSGQGQDFQFVTQRKETPLSQGLQEEDQLSSSSSQFNQKSGGTQKKEKIEGKNKILFNNQRLDRYEEDDRFKQWSTVDNELPPNESPVWSTASSVDNNNNNEDNTKSKTLPFPSLPTLDILEDPGYSYDHGRPTWPLSEYLSDKFSSFYNTRGTNKTTTKDYEWQQLKPSPHFGSSTSASHNYDTNEKDRYRDNSHNYRIYNGHNVYGHRYSGASSDNNDIRGHQSGTHTTIVSTAADVSKGASSSSSSGGESSNRGATKHGPFGHYGPHGGGYGWPPPYPPHGPHYFPPDYYPKKRFRLKIHPGYIAAPLAGLAAFGAATALTNKPLLFELGLVNNKYRYAHGHQYPHHHYYPQPHDLHYPGHGWASNVVPVYPQVNPPVIGSPATALSPQYPILKPDEHSYSPQYQHHSGHHLHHHHHHGHHGHHYQPEHTTDKKPWWNPFAALTPRD